MVPPAVSPVRKLASQTAVYGLSSIVGRFLNYLLVPLYTYTFPAGAYGVVSEFYAYAGFLAVVLAFGLETGYFRFRHRDEPTARAAYPAALGFLLAANLAFVLAMVAVREPLARWLRYPGHADYVVLFALILACDAIASLPFARLRAEQRAWRFAAIKCAEILVAITLNLAFLLGWPKAAALWPDSLLARVYDPTMGVGYIFWANLIASGVKLLLLAPQFRGIRFRDGLPLIRPLLAYSLPMVAIGLAGMVNEMLDRAILKYLLPYDPAENLRILGIYGACYKLSVLMTLFVQAFRYAGEPFFFAYAGRADAKPTYARVMHYFVIGGVLLFLAVTLYLDAFKYLIGPEYREGLEVVPILLLANLFLGIYVNLSIWYKLTDRTLLGAWVSIGAAALTVALNLWWIPILGYRGSAWAHLACYGGMAVVSYLLGRRYYPVPYPLGRIFAHLLCGLLLYRLDRELVGSCGWNPWTTGSALLALYLAGVSVTDFRPLWLGRRTLHQRAPG
ncbi:Membrane protein involved in the export of O-antigen and teichoic acid [Candidatus Methylocalor cossyra]|uniref:Membrane protein involved in the export of O-antigen and teichoic acid n=1 Tax=Candidatus Methylocalor cossyra TaxID=3108543 RepID=A0ABM9NM19_9GAMM